MKNKDLKNLLKDTLEMEKELYDFCIECLTKLYGENATIAITDFEAGYEQYEFNGCIQGLSCIDNEVQRVLKHRVDYINGMEKQ